ncbi:putative chromatin remodeler Bromodomain family [Helianthus debilis subsp. tardiflorus]
MLKDTHVDFSEPVDLNELPDYHDIIKHPMDFGTVRSKLIGGLYSNLEELESDV